LPDHLCVIFAPEYDKENVGLIINSYEGASARSIDLRVGGTSALTLASTGATFSSSVGIGASPASLLYAYSSTSTAEFRLERGGVGDVGARWKRNGSDLGYISNADWIIAGASSTDFGVTAVNNLVFGTAATERMRITSGGNVGIGTSSPVSTNLTGSLTIVKSYSGDTPTSTSAQAYDTNQSNLYLFGRNAGLTLVGNNGEEAVIAFANASSYYIGAIRYDMGANSTGGAMKFQTGGTNERMRIESGGDIRINMPNSTNRYLSWYSGNGLYQVAAVSSISDPSYNDAGYLIFSTAKTSSAGFTEKARITPDGNLLLGTTDNGSGAKLVFYSTTAAQQLKAAGTAPAITFSNTITSPTIGGVLGAATAAGHFITGTAAGDMVLANQFSTGALIFGTSNVERMRIINNGNISMATSVDYGYKLNLNGQPGCNGYTAWTNWSDSRLKENVTDFDATNVLDKICAIRPVTYNYNELSGFDEETRARRISGFIAQELKEIFPDMVGTIKKDNVEYYDTNLSNLDLYIVKAIQQLAAEIKTLKNK